MRHRERTQYAPGRLEIWTYKAVIFYFLANLRLLYVFTF